MVKGVDSKMWRAIQVGFCDGDEGALATLVLSLWCWDLSWSVREERETFVWCYKTYSISIIRGT